MESKPRVAIVYDGFPHYRKGVIEELASSTNCDYCFVGDATYRDASIKAYQFAAQIDRQITTSFALGPFHVQWGILRALRRKEITHCIFLGNPWFIAYWALTPILRLRNVKVYYWTHGWISREEPLMRRLIKELFFRLPNGLLLYGRRAKEIGASRGFSPERMHVLNNSLDYKAQKSVYQGLSAVSQGTLRTELQLPQSGNIIICTARLTRKCRFDVLIRAAHILKGMNRDVFIVLVGDGPEREALSGLAESLGVTHRFWGACYDEMTIAKLHKAADLTVSPGKVGLTAMHSMAYGTPVISHDNLDHQMPEVEAISPGVTGAFFAENSSEDLAKAIAKWFTDHPSKPERACVARIEAEFTPSFQRRVIEAALLGRAVES
ncbi:MAG: glycosyltransferase [Steroidobacteraceae bacterium]|jgi:glycosyltransferase involved in cell wall biosynthesis